ncbi:T9SS type A sorting domain-containing protein [Sporocytophaga myxococcoides]|uniref:T9SS type A sorting domain-containing protein n=1 Tax=Sporocytophaga myxococcoides TaxID=153721 RepID=UPI00048E7226|nr:T9SS type A sorting domain-containing protein [Sporocytophaga myxococcoides]
MKFFTIFCFFLCLSLGLVAQDYSPLRKGVTYQYATTNRDTLFTLRIDSAYAVGSDSIFELDKKYIGCVNDECISNILGRKIIKSPDKVFSFITLSKDTLVLKLNESLNTSWIFSKRRNLEATIFSKSYEKVFDLMDSLITIRLSNGKEIKISKSYGLYSTESPFEYIAPISGVNTVNFFSYKLDAIRELKLGNYFATLENIYNFEVGDKWGQLEEAAEWPRPIMEPREKIYYKVLNKWLIEGTTSYDYKIQRIKKSYNWDVTIDTLSLERYRMETYDYNSGIFDRLTYEYNYGLNEVHYENYITYIDHDSLKVQSIVNFESSFYHVYSPGIGLVSYYDANWGGGPNEYKMTTVCYKKGDKVFGNCDEWLAIILDTKHAMIDSKIEILPNPASEFINIENAISADYELINCYGSVVFKGIIETDQEVISVNSLEEGLYYLKLESLGSSIVRKIVVLH